jgi:hypothetical protein
MTIGLNILRTDPRDGIRKYELQGVPPDFEGLPCYVGLNPRTVNNTHEGFRGHYDRPWIIPHPDCEGRVYRALAIERFASLACREGETISLVVREWDEATDGSIYLETTEQ